MPKIIPHENDVLLGRGGGTNSHPGNARYRSLVEPHRSEFRTAGRGPRKRELAAGVVDAVRGLDPPGRFLTQQDGTEGWVEVDYNRAITKVMARLRENKDGPATPAEVRKKKEMKQSSKKKETKRPPTRNRKAEFSTAKGKGPPDNDRAEHAGDQKAEGKGSITFENEASLDDGHVKPLMSNKGKRGKGKRGKQKAIMATTYSYFSYVRMLDADMLGALDFTGFDEKFGRGKLDELFPKDPKCGQLDPPPLYLVSGKKVREWRAMGTMAQRLVIRQQEEQGEEQRQGKRPLPSNDSGNDAAVVSTSEARATAEDDQPDTDGLIANDTGSEGQTNLPKRQKTSITPGRCRGITKRHILALKCRDVDRIERGFRRLVGKAYIRKGEKISTTGEWNHGDDVAGFVIDNNNSNYSWKCVQAGTNVWAFHLYDCDLGANLPVGVTCCRSCRDNSSDFYEMCREEFDKRS